MSEQADVVIIGGGLVGTAAAFFLRRRGCSVILLERGLVGSQASGANFGNVRRQGRFLGQLPLANRSRAIWGQLPDLIGDDVEFMPTGHLRVVYDPEQIGVIETYARDARDYGLDLELIGGNTLRDRFPFIGPEALAGSYGPLDGHANPRLAAPAFARAAMRSGAAILENTEVTGITRTGDGFLIETRKGSFRSPVVLVAAGAWGGRLSAQFGEPVPLTVKSPQMAVTEPVPYVIRPVVGVSTQKPEEVVYLRQIPRGNIIFGGSRHGPADPNLLRSYVAPASTLQQFGQIRRLVPALAHLHIIRTWGGIEGYMDDHLPVMGPSLTTSGLFYAFGFSGHGFQTAPGVGDVMAELIATGTTTTPIEPFGMGRFTQITEASDAAL